MIAVSQVMTVLTPWLGPALFDGMLPAARKICVRFAGYAPKQSLRELCDGLYQLLTVTVSGLTGGTFRVFPSPGQEVEMCRDDFDILTDDIMFLLFSEFPADRSHLRLLEAYAEETGSLSALRAVYVSFGALISQSERSTLKKVILGYPSFRLYWLEDSPGGFQS